MAWGGIAKYGSGFHLVNTRACAYPASLNGGSRHLPNINPPPS